MVADEGVQAMCASAVNNICTYVIGETEKEQPRESSFLRQSKENTHVLPYLLVSLLHTVLFEDSSVQWSLSRPLLGLIILQRDVSPLSLFSLCHLKPKSLIFHEKKKKFFERDTETVIGTQLSAKQEPLREALQLLMTNIEPNLQTHNRERFTQNMTALRLRLQTEELVLRAPTADVIRAVSQQTDAMGAEQLGNLLDDMTSMSMAA